MPALSYLNYYLGKLWARCTLHLQMLPTQITTLVHVRGWLLVKGIDTCKTHAEINAQIKGFAMLGSCLYLLSQVNFIYSIYCSLLSRSFDHSLDTKYFTGKWKNHLNHLNHLNIHWRPVFILYFLLKIKPNINFCLFCSHWVLLLTQTTLHIMKSTVKHSIVMCFVW